VDDRLLILIRTHSQTLSLDTHSVNVVATLT
jgi:hypothetical protein